MKKFFYWSALGLLTVILGVCVLSSWITPYDPLLPDLDALKQAPSLSHLMGTDDRGRDVLSRIIAGGRFSISLGIFTTVFALLIGIIFGFISGYYCGWMDSLAGVAINITLAFPSLLLAIALSSVMEPGYKSIFVTLVVIGWAGFAKLIRGETLKLKNSPHVQAARVLGASDLYIFLKHILPLSAGIIITAVTLRVGVSILMESSLSFLGLGIQPPMPTWGGMVSQGRDFFRSAPWMTMFPGIIITLTILSLNIAGEGYKELSAHNVKKYK
ncbi:ABC transporter permease [bacterium]|nr:ABC transporter permease [bacterium]